MVEWRDWGAVCAGTLDTKPMTVGAKYITLDEVISLALKHPSFRSAPITIEDQIPVFTAWVENALKGSTLSRKNSCWRKRKAL
jgi:hypothetical protein